MEASRIWAWEGVLIWGVIYYLSKHTVQGPFCSWCWADKRKSSSVTRTELPIRKRRRPGGRCWGVQRGMPKSLDRDTVIF